MKILNLIKESLGFKKDSIFFEQKIGIDWTGYKNESHENIKISRKYSLYDFTRTDIFKYIDENRKVTKEEIEKLSILAYLMDTIDDLLGGIDIHSARRCKKVNDLVGSTDKSQHLLCEACDFSPRGIDTKQSVESAFFKLIKLAKEDNFDFGQLILEEAKRDYGKAYWIHISLGEPWRENKNSRQVLRMLDGKYTFIERLS